MTELNIRISEDNVTVLSLGLPSRAVSDFLCITVPKEQYKEYKQQILNNQAIVERVKEFHKQYELVMVGLELPDKSAQLVIQGTYAESFRKLKEILETTKHSECSRGKTS